MKKLTMGFIINFSYCIAMVSCRSLIFERPCAAEKSDFSFRGLFLGGEQGDKGYKDFEIKITRV